MPQIEVGKKAPNFTGIIKNDAIVTLKELRGKNVVLYFYPRDNTPGCTKEAQEFSQNIKKFQNLNTIILGISRDTVSKHEKFRAKYELAFDLISDEDEKICKAFDVMKIKNMYGKKVMGIERSTFIINDEGTLIHEWRKVKVEGHVKTVLETIKNFK